MEYAYMAYDGAFVADVLSPVKSGKEATVFCCSAQDYTGLEYVAAKVYRPLETRSFRNDAVYQQGRYIKDARLRRAYRKKSRAGQGAQFGRWVQAEYSTMQRLFQAGAKIPEPLNTTGTAIIMSYIGDGDGPAPTLYRTRLQKGEAKELFDFLMQEIDLWLSVGVVHADLSPFNVLYWKGGLWAIDFPQSVDPFVNRNAFDLLCRDISNICRYFRRYGIESNSYKLAHDIWARNSTVNMV